MGRIKRWARPLEGGGGVFLFGAGSKFLFFLSAVAIDHGGPSESHRPYFGEPINTYRCVCVCVWPRSLQKEAATQSQVLSRVTTLFPPVLHQHSTATEFSRSHLLIFYPTILLFVTQQRKRKATLAYNCTATSIAITSSILILLVSALFDHQQHPPPWGGGGRARDLNERTASHVFSY